MASAKNRERGIPPPIVPDEALRFIKFSFKYIDHNSDQFNLQECSEDFLRQLVLKVFEYSSWSLDAFRDSNNDDNRHVIDFRETCRPRGFTNVNREQLAYEECWQFGLSHKADYRVHGILLEDTFFVIWLDPEHLLYPRKRP